MIAAAAGQHAGNVLETVREERDSRRSSQREGQQLLAEEHVAMMEGLQRERNLIIEKKDAWIHALEKLLAQLEEFEGGIQQRRRQRRWNESSTNELNATISYGPS